MFYVLNFSTHQFTSCDDLMAVDNFIRRALAEGCSKASLEILNGFMDEVRLDVDQFRTLCLDLGTLVEVYPDKQQNSVDTLIAGAQAKSQSSSSEKISHASDLPQPAPPVR